MLTQTIKARVTPDLIERLDRIVAAGILDRSDHIRKALVDYVESHEAAAQAKPGPTETK